jgi:hypothetical protein
VGAQNVRLAVAGSLLNARRINGKTGRFYKAAKDGYLNFALVEFGIHALPTPANDLA